MISIILKKTLIAGLYIIVRSKSLCPVKKKGLCIQLDIAVVLFQEFAQEGLRTLCLAVKDISSSEYTSWARKFKEAR